MSQRSKAAWCWGLQQLRHLLPCGAVTHGCQSPSYRRPPRGDLSGLGRRSSCTQEPGGSPQRPACGSSKACMDRFFLFFFLTPWGNNQHPLTRESWWCSLCCRQTRRRGWCWLLCGRPSVWPSRGLWYRRNSQSRHGSSQNYKTQNKMKTGY